MLINHSGRILKTLLLILVLALSVTLFIYLLIGFSNKNDTEEAAIPLLGPCSIREQDSILSEAVSVFLSSNGDEITTELSPRLDALENRIKNEKGYLDDANCQHILAMIYLDRSTPIEAERSLSRLKDILENNNPESYILDENVNFYSIKDMETILEVINYNAKQFFENDLQRTQDDLNE